MCPKPLTYLRKTVRLVTSQTLGTFTWATHRLSNGDAVQERLDLSRFVPLSSSYFHYERQASTISNQMEFAAESAP